MFARPKTIFPCRRSKPLYGIGSAANVPDRADRRQWPEQLDGQDFPSLRDSVYKLTISAGCVFSARQSNSGRSSDYLLALLYASMMSA